MSARLTQTDSLDPDLTDRELLSHEVIQRNSSSDNVAAGIAGSKVHPVVAFECFDRLSLDQRQFEFGERFEERSQLERVAVAFQSHTRNRQGLLDGARGRFGGCGNVDGFHGPFPHG